jgi:hypothetical protein
MLKPTTLALLAAMAAVPFTACSDAASDGRYATHDRGRSNNRAELPPAAPLPIGEALGR